MIDNDILNMMNKYNVDSLSIYDGKFHYYGNSKEEIIFEAASLTKVLFAFIVLRMCVDNLIDLDKPLVSYVALFKTSSDPRFKYITAKHILSHSSGLENWSHQDDLPMHFMPGDGFMYSGEGYEYLQKVVEKISNKTIEELFKEYIFIPFKMNNSYLSFKNQFEFKIIDSYDENKNIEINRERMIYPNVAYSLYTTIEDYEKFATSFFVKKNYSKELELMNKGITKVSDEVSWNLGISLIKDNLFWQYGDNDNFKNFFLFDKALNKVFILFSNSFNGLKVIYDILVKSYNELCEIKTLILE